MYIILTRVEVVVWITGGVYNSDTCCCLGCSLDHRGVYNSDNVNVV